MGYIWRYISGSGSLAICIFNLSTDLKEKNQGRNEITKMTSSLAFVGSLLLALACGRAVEMPISAATQDAAPTIVPNIDDPNA